MPKQSSPSRDWIADFERVIDALHHRTLRTPELADRDTEELRALIEKKKRAGQDLVQTAIEKNGSNEIEDEN